MTGLPLIGLPDGQVEAGLGCRVEDADSGWVTRPCQTVDDYGAWMALRWTL